MSLLHDMAVSAALRRTRTLAVEDQAPAAYPVIIDAFSLNAAGGLSPALTVTAPSAARAAALVKTLSPYALSVTCRVPPRGVGGFAPWIAVHTTDPETGRILATGMSLGIEAEQIETGEMEPRQGPSRVIAEVLSGADATLNSRALKSGETGFLYTEDPYVARPVSQAFYWPSVEGFLLTAKSDGFGYTAWQEGVSCLLGSEEDDWGTDDECHR